MIRQAELLAAIQPYVDKATRLIADRVDDAHAHAVKTLTQAAIDESAGRPTLRRIDWSRSFEAASSRLDELLDALAGPSTTSRKGIIRDGFETAYRDCYAHYRLTLDPAVLAGSPEPTKAQIVKARTVVVLGYDARAYLVPVVNAAESRLKALLASLANPGRSKADRTDQLAAWASRTTDGLTTAATIYLKTGSFYLDRIAGRDTIRPELLHDDPTIPG